MKSQNNWIKYSNLGFQIIATIGVFGWIGYLLDSSDEIKAWGKFNG